MTKFPKIASATGLVALFTLAGCGSMNAPMSTNAPSTTYYPPTTTSGNVYERYGVVQSVELVRKDNSGIGAGMIVGAVVGVSLGTRLETAEAIPRRL